MILLLCLCALGTQPAWPVDPSSRIAQYGHTAWRSSEGHFDSELVALAQTKDGYLWIGSASGLIRFDGVRFVKWSSADGVKLPSNNIYSLFVGRDGSLWIGTAIGLAHLKDGVLTNLKSSEGGIRSIAQDDAGTVWVARSNMRTPTGALCKVAGTELQCIGPAQGLPMPYAKTVACDHEGNIWVGGATSYVRWSPKSQTVYAPEAFKNNAEISAIGSMVVAPNGHPLIGMMHVGPGMGLEEMVEGKPRPYGPAEGIDVEREIAANVIRFDSHGDMWIGTPAGVVRIHHGIADRYDLADGLSGRNVTDILEDYEGNMWIATDDGIDRLRDMPVRSFGQRDGMQSNSTHTVLTLSNGQLLFSDGTQLNLLQSGDRVTIQAEKEFTDKGFIPVLFQASDGAVWMSMGEQLLRYDHGAIQKIARPKDAPPHTQTLGLAEDKDGDILALQGLTPDLWKVHNGVATRVATSSTLVPAMTMAMDRDGSLWFTSITGELGRLRGNSLDSISINSGSSKSIRQITATADNAILGSTKIGLFVYKDGKQVTLGLASGLPCESINYFAFDHDGNLWMSAACGTMEVLSQDWLAWRRDSKTKVKARLFDVLDGARVSAGPVWHGVDVTPDGRVWFATGSALQMVDPASLAINKVVPPVHIEELLADGVAMDTGRPLHLPALTRQLQIDYTATSLSIPQRVLFRYKLDGHDRDWQSAGTRRQAFYNDLKPGTYRFTVLACNNSGLWNEVGSSITFTVAPAWFQTRWFLALCVLVAGATLYGLYRLRVRQVRKRLQLQYDTRLEERTRVARDLHDTLLQTIQGTKLVAEEALHGEDDLTQLHDVVAKIHEWLSRAVIEGRAALTALRSGSSAGLLTDKLRSAAEECAEGCGMKLRFELIGVPTELSPTMTEEIFRIGYEAIRNACAHSRGSILEVELVYGKMLKLTVKDNGIGFDANGPSGRISGHYGIDGMRERAQQLGGSLSVSSTPEDGTEVSLSVRHRGR